MPDLQSYVSDFTRSVGIFVAIIAVLSLLEAIMPFRARRVVSGRTRANLTLFGIFFALSFALNAILLGSVVYFESRGWGVLAHIELPLIAILLGGVVLLDLASYVAHVLMHKVGFLWRIHSVHHSDVHIDATTAFRQHPLEGLVRFAFTLGPALALGLPLEVVALYRFLSGLNAIFEHMNLRLWRPLDALLVALIVSPNMHKVHHSRLQAETDSNYGNLLSIWDRVFRTYSKPGRAYECVYGLDEYPDNLGVGQLLNAPFRSVKKRD
jgi:sterol desaturase/sphingolipid hydroxylase (fatty acid hydroxylase superfamily)